MNDAANNTAHEKILTEIGEMKEVLGELRGEFRGVNTALARGREKFDEHTRRIAMLEQDKKRDRWVIGLFSAVGGAGVVAAWRNYFGG